MSWPNVISQIGGFLTLLFLRPTKYDLLCVMLMPATADVLVVCTCAYMSAYIHMYVHTYRVVCIQCYYCLVSHRPNV